MVRTLALVVLAVVAATGLAAQTYPLNQQDPSAVFSWGTATARQEGWRFQCNSAGVQVTHLSCWFQNSNTQSYTLTLFNFSTGGVLAQVTTSIGTGWRNTALATPVSLTNGAQYIVAGWASGTVATYTGGSAPSSWIPTGTIQYLDSRWLNGTTGGVMPTNIIGGNAAYGVVDIGYNTGPGISASTSTLGLGSTPPGTAGTPVSYTVSGNSTTNQTVVTAPTGVEVSFSQSSGYANSITITSTGTWGPTTVWARITSSASAGTISGNITHVSTGMTTVNVAVDGFVGSVTWPLQQTSSSGLTAYNSSAYNMGYAFTTSQSNVTVTQLSGMTPVAGTLQVCLWDSTSTSAPIATVTTANGAAGAWRSGVLATPITLVAGRQYRVATVCGPNWYYLSAATGPWAPSGVINWVSSCWGASTTPIYPSNGNSEVYGVADIGYNTGPAVTASTSSINLGTTPQGTPGTAVSYTVSGAQLTALTQITAPTGVNISFNQTTGYAQSLQINTTPSYTNVTIWARLTGATAGTVTGNITHTSAGATGANVAVNGTVTGPTLTPSTSTINLGSTPQGTPGTAVSYTLSGSALQGNTTITAPTGVNVSFSQTTGFAQSITITTFPAYTGTVIWARLTGAAAGTITGNITHASTGATTVNVSVNGTVTPPTVTPSVSTLNLGSTPEGTAGTAINYTVSGSALTGPTTITAPAGVEVSFDQATGYAASIQITTTPGYTGTVVWARMTGATAMIITGNITHAAAGATTANVSVSGNTWVLTPNPTSLNLGVTVVGTPGTPQSYTLTGAGLTANTTVTAPAGIEISDAQAGTYGPTLNINQTPTLSATVWVRLTGASLGTFGGNITNVAGSASANVAVTGQVTPPNNLSVTRNGPASTTMVDNDAQGAGGNGLVILDFTLATAQAAWTVTDLEFTASGTADEQAGLNFLALYEDINTNGTFDGPGTDTLATATAGTSFNGANGIYTATLTNTAWAASTTRRFFLVCRLSGSAIAGQTVQAELTTVTASSGGGGAVVGAPTSGANPALTINAAVLTATLVGPVAFTTVNNDSQGPGGNGHVVAEVTLAARNDAWTVTSLTFTESGSMDGQAGLSFLALYLDNGNGTFDGPGTDTLATAAAGTSFNAPNGTCTATLTAGAGTYTVNQSKRFFLVAMLAGTASPGQQLRVALTSAVHNSASGGTLAGAPTAVSSALVIDVPILTVNAGPANPGTQTREQGATGFQVMVGNYRFTSSNADFVISGFVLSTSGNGNWAGNLDGTTGVQVYRDDGNGTFEVTDTLVFSGAGSTPSVNCTFTANQTIPMGTNVDFWVVYNVLATAGGSPAEVFDSQIAAAGSVQAVTTGGMVAIGTVAPTSATLRVVTYALTSITPTASLPAGGAAITITGSGFALPVTLTIGGVNCPGVAVVNAGGTQITGLNVPTGSGQNLAIVLNTNNLGPKTLAQTFSYSNVTVFGAGGGGGGGGGGGCATGIAATPAAILIPMLVAFWRRRKTRKA